MAAVLVSALVLAAACGGSPAARPPQPTPAASSTPPTPAPNPPPSHQTLTYCTVAGQALAVDLWAPTSGSPLPAPLALHVHGGGWTSGSRLGGGWLGDLQPRLSAEGFMVASIDYRLATANPWPDQIDDVNCALGFLRASAAQLQIDPNRIGIWGESAGGHLVSLVGTERSPGVRAVADLFGPADLTSADWSPGTARILNNVFGPTIAVRHAASPALQVAPGDPPFLILQGDYDTTVPVTQSVEFAQRLSAAGVPVDLVVVKGGTHGLSGGAMSPAQSELESLLVSFLKTHTGAAG